MAKDPRDCTRYVRLLVDESGPSEGGYTANAYAIYECQRRKHHFGKHRFTWIRWSGRAPRDLPGRALGAESLVGGMGDDFFEGSETSF